jgi:hypothetical protein
MTEFQSLCTGLFALVAGLVYRQQLVTAAKTLFGKAAAARTDDAPVVQPSIAVNLVNDIVSVTNLRDRLSAEGCKEGVDACTVLLRVIVEYQQPSKGVV